MDHQMMGRVHFWLSASQPGKVVSRVLNFQTFTARGHQKQGSGRVELSMVTRYPNWKARALIGPHNTTIRCRALGLPTSQLLAVDAIATMHTILLLVCCTEDSAAQKGKLRRLFC